MKRTTSLFLLIAFLGCQTVPGTGRRQFNLVPMGQQLQMGDQAYAEMLGNAQIVTSGADYVMVQRVGQRIARAANKLYPDPSKQFDWEFKLVKDDATVNAWALPGGKSAVYTGLLKVTQDEESLAAVMGHEAAHAIAQHGAERITQTMGLQLGLTAVGAYIGSRESMSSGQRDAILAGLGAGASVGIMLPFSRSHESEADEIGVYIAGAAGYNPEAAIGLWERMADLGGDKPPEFLSTHPSEATRIADLKKAMPRAKRYYKRSQGR
ncbi:MAG TPA: M48 family metallopeptidase [Planctomycetota bacterium]